MTPRTVGVEEEFLLVDPSDGQPRAVASAVLAADQARTPKEPAGEEDPAVEAELQLQQVETGTKPCRTLDELDKQLRSTRRQAAEAARSRGVEIAAIGTSPVPVQAELTPAPRYRRMVRRFGMTVHEQLTCGCHVHVGVDDDEERVAVLDRIRPWLAPLHALSGNSPFWQGEDSRYASYRSQVWARWPSAGPTELFGSAEAYHSAVTAMTDSGTVLDAGMVYFDARLSQHYPTVEIRVADVCLDAAHTLLLAALARALVETAARAWAAGHPPQPVRMELLRLAAWRAGRSGLDGDLVDPRTLLPAPARTVLDALLAHVHDALEDAGELTEVHQLHEALWRDGTGAARQRSIYGRTGTLADVVADSVRRTQN